MLTLVTAPQTEPITLAEAKLHLRIDTATEDAPITAWIAAARQYGEAFTGRAFIEQTWDDKRAGFPYWSDGVIWLPKPPVTSVPSITYIDTNGTSQTWAADQYQKDLPSGPTAARARITTAYGVTYPSTRSVFNAVTVRFVCGYGTAADVPEAIKAAMLLLIQYNYERQADEKLKAAAESLLWPYRSF